MNPPRLGEEAPEGVEGDGEEVVEEEGWGFRDSNVVVSATDNIGWD